MTQIDVTLYTFKTSQNPVHGEGPTPLGPAPMRQTEPLYIVGGFTEMVDYSTCSYSGLHPI